MKPLFAALRFLSILPVPQSWSGQDAELSRSVKFFPIVGVIMGAIVAVLAWATGLMLPHIVTAAIVVILQVVITRGLHLDGMADTADGFWSVSDRARTLDIMKDSHTGAMGVIAIASVLLLKFACLATINTHMIWRAVLLMIVTGRCMMTIPISIFPYARKEGGLARIFYETRTPFNAVWATLAALTAGWLIACTAGLAAVIAAVIATAAFGFYCKWKIGGGTGDTIGATCEITEIVTLLIMCAWPWPASLLA